MLFATTLPDSVRRLHEVDLFAACTTRDLRRIEQMATTVTVPAGRVLCRHGEIGRESFIVLDGILDVTLCNRKVAVGSGAVVGEIALLTPNGRRTATLTARTEATVLAFTRTEFGHLLAVFPVIAHDIVRESARRLLEDIDI
jgi:CRP/FNR family transcriptional regulator, cyclic AMP receptor protein